MPVKPRSFAEDIGSIRTLRDNLRKRAEECSKSRIHKVKSLTHYAQWAAELLDFAIEHQGLRLWELNLPKPFAPNMLCSIGDTSQFEVDLEYKEGR